jgi:simple sugar transport system permease protein
MAGGRGFIALAALIFGGWKPVQTGLACLLFATADAAQILLQGKSVFDIAIPNSIIQIVPYVVTLALLAMRYSQSGRALMKAPMAINRPV